ncbi:MAG TPA: nodulation protein NfeD [Gaiellales bacterium]|jgi:membrane-bound serine protease (ClpP class)|nr:nodulation protein NfeD [Gaiellales bacterium]
MRTLCLLAVALIAGLALAPGAEAKTPSVRVVVLDADVDPVTADWVVGEIHAAAKAHDSAIVLELETPGGLLDSMRKITQAELRSPVPVLAFVAPSGARAASAGFFLLQAADIAAMVPASNTGAATPIDMGGGNVGSDLRSKLIHDAEAQIRFLASGSGRNAKAAAQAVEPKSSACPNCPRSWTASEALRDRVIDVIADDVPSLLDKTNGRVTVRKHLRLQLASATLERHELPFQLRLLDVLLDPNLITLLFLGGILGIAFELTHPGIVLPGLLGTVALLLALLGLSIVPFSWAGVALLVFGIALLGLEAHSPAHGAFAAVGTLSVLLGGVLLFRVDNSPYGTTSFWLVLAIAGSLALISMFVISRVWAARRLPPRGPGVPLVGELATVLTPLSPHGQVLVHGERWQAEVQNGRAEPGEQVRIIAEQGLTLEVVREPMAETAGRPAATRGAP